MRFKTLLRLLIILAVLGALAFVGLPLLRPTAIVEAVARGTAPDAVPGTLSVRADRTVLLVSDVGGRIATSALELGASVTEDDVLAELDAAALKVEIRQTETDIAALRRRMEVGSALQFDLLNQQEDLATKERLLERGAVAQLEVDRLKRAIKLQEQRIELEKLDLQQRLDTLENSLELKQIQLGKMTIRSPISGVVTQLHAYPDDLIGPGTTIAEIISAERIVEVKVSEEKFSRIREGQEATVRLLGYGGTRFDATVSKLLPAADTETQRYTVFLDVDIEPEKLVPGLTGEALIIVDEHENAVLVPRSAMVGDRVYVVADDRVEFRTVRSGFVGLNRVEIVDGLSEGELVIVDELDRFRDGARVRVVERNGK